MALILACVASAVLGAPGGLEPAQDLQRDAREMAQDGKPMVVLYSQNGCQWCDVARSHLVPRATQAGGEAIALFRQIDLDTDADLVDFDGRATTHARHARAENIRFTPVLVFYGAGGEQLVEPIVGMRLPEFYGLYVDQAITAARERMRSPKFEQAGNPKK